MDLNAIYRKTQKGLEEMAHRTVLGMRERTLLVMVDGKTTAAELLARARHMPDPPGLLAKLIDGGFIEASASAAPPPVAAQPSVKEAVAFARSYLTDNLGPNADQLVMSLEKCKTAAELRSRVEQARQILKSMGNPRKADEFWAGVEPLLPPG
jgi:hypothetical protein